MFNPKKHMIQLKGKDYLQVMWRLVWVRDEIPDVSIITQLISHDGERGEAVFTAKIVNEKGIIATGHGSETRKDFRDYLEKAETKAVGRALAYAGFGTQYAPELDEGSRIVDSPVAKDIAYYYGRVDKGLDAIADLLVIDREDVRAQIMEADVGFPETDTATDWTLEEWKAALQAVADYYKQIKNGDNDDEVQTDSTA